MLFDQGKIEEVVKAVVVESGFDLIELKLIQSGQKTIRAIVDYPEGGIKLRDCADVNKRILSRFFDLGIEIGDYNLEINSPGLDRRLEVYKDFLRVKGRPVLLWLNEPVCGKQYLEGEVIDLNQKELTIKYNSEIVVIDFKKIKLGKEKIMIKGGIEK